MNSSADQVSYQPEPSDLHQIIHELANVLQRCLSVRVSEGPRTSREDVVKFRESVSQACDLVHLIAERVENLPCLHAEKRSIRSTL